MIAIICAPKNIVRPYMQTMGPAEDAFAPGGQECAVAVKHRDWMCAAAENKDTVLAINGDCRDFLETPTIRQAPPTGDGFITEIATAKYLGHARILAELWLRCCAGLLDLSSIEGLH
jgi:hypothetical protein